MQQTSTSTNIMVLILPTFIRCTEINPKWHLFRTGKAQGNHVMANLYVHEKTALFFSKTHYDEIMCVTIKPASSFQYSFLSVCNNLLYIHIIMYTKLSILKKYYTNKQCNLIETENDVQIIIIINVIII